MTLLEMVPLDLGDLLLGIAAVLGAVGGFLLNVAQIKKQSVELKKQLTHQSAGISDVQKELKPNTGSTTRDDVNFIKEMVTGLSDRVDEGLGGIRSDIRGIRRDVGRLQDQVLFITTHETGKETQE